jgi:RNA polymerase sigma factor (sigma-70 family)
MRADVHDTVLARRAAKGDGAAFAALYDRHERRAYNLCYRITGSAEDAADATQETFLKVLERLPSLSERELNFGSYLLTAARHASYDAIERRKRATPAAEIPDSAIPVATGEAVDGPEPSALRAVHQEEIRAANGGLPPRQREALALRELEDLSYDQVADIMGMNRNAVAQLISRARINLRDGLLHGALVSIPAASAECESALPLLALAQDGELDDATSADWLARHLVGCATCRVRVEAMQEAGAAYRLWMPLVPVLWLRDAAVAKAAERTSATTARVSRPRQLAVLAGAGLALLSGAGLAVADVVHAPTHPRIPATTAYTLPTPQLPVVVAVHHERRRHTPKPKPKRKHVAPPPVAIVVTAPVPTPVPVVASRPVPVPAPKPKPHVRSHVAQPAETETPDVAIDPLPPVVEDVPPVVVDPTPTPTPAPPGKPPRQLPCPNCPIVGGGAPPVP